MPTPFPLIFRSFNMIFILYQTFHINKSVFSDNLYIFYNYSVLFFTKKASLLCFLQNKNASFLENILENILHNNLLRTLLCTDATTCTFILIDMCDVICNCNSAFWTVLFTELTSDTSNRTCVHNIFTLIA